MTGSDLEAAIAACMLADQPRFTRRLATLGRKERGKNGIRRARSRLRDEIARSVERRRRRLSDLPRAAPLEELPIASARGEIAETIKAHPVTIVCGETGSGKSTQLPKICLSLRRGVSGYIGHTQPRRIAARSVAMRIASELGSATGNVVGHKVRFDRDVSEDSYIKVMTDGILLAEIQSDPKLLGYDTIIIDEAHERSLNIDFLLGYLKLLLPSRPDLKVVVSSATIDTRRFSDFFDGAPVVEVAGRAYPVEVRYRPADSDESDGPDPVSHAVDAISGLWNEAQGDILAFFPGEREIVEAARALREKKLEGAEILPLYARLPLAGQRRAIEPGKVRRVVLATNVAETSLTVPNVRAVVDTGVARISRYNRHSGVQRLPVEPVSRASAAQRKGRCGRVGPGVCVRLYAESDHDSRPEYTEPEILRTNLASVLLRMRALGIRELDAFPFIDAPARRHVNDGLRLLRELGALDSHDQLTETGQRLARLPLDPRLGRMLLAAEVYDCVADILVIASALSVSDPRDRPPGREAAADAAHRRFADGRSDFLTLLNLWALFFNKTRGLPENAIRKFCRKRFLSFTRMREWRDVHDQLRALAAELGIHRGRIGAGYARVHKALLAGLLRNVGFLSAEREYTGVRGANFRVVPGSAQHPGQAKWIMAGELVETSRLYAFTAARVRPEWVEEAAGDLVRKSYFDAHWDEKRGEPMVYEQTALYGLTIIPKRRRRYGAVSLEEARRIFIRAALVEERMDRDPPFLRHNRTVVARLRSFDHRMRQPDVFISDGALFDFYDHRVPSQVCDVASFEGWVRQLDEDDIDDLSLNEEAITEGKMIDDFSTRFPDELEAGGRRFALRYRFAPGEPDDGITMLVPLDVLGELEPRSFDRLIPGYLEEKVQSLLRALPKSLRREIVPLSEFCTGFVNGVAAPGGSLTGALAAHARRVHGVDIPPGAWRTKRLPDHLRMRFAILDAGGHEIARGRDLADLQRRFAGGRTSATETAMTERDGLTDWSVDDLEDEVRVRHGNRDAVVYPMLEDRGDCVCLTASESRERALELHRQGVRRLFLLTRQRELRRVKKNLPGLERLELAYSAVRADPPAWQRQNGTRAELEGTTVRLAEQILQAAVTEALGESGADVRREADFRHNSERAFAALPSLAADLCALCEDILERHRRIHRDIEENPPPASAQSSGDIRLHLDSLVYRGFILATPLGHLKNYPRYLEALERRIGKIRLGGSKDGDKVSTLAPLWERFEARAMDHLARGRSDPERERYRWMLEEYRVSLFAQELGTAFPVSQKRLDNQWARVSS
ncbi:MAG TPA: ATP-dependent RNA helicase HrpA [Gammaproteobacteria bacterium]|nr:ATP-dependent RNA helicase HrpA [Gammaproteobacteria bacterium]